MDKNRIGSSGNASGISTPLSETDRSNIVTRMVEDYIHSHAQCEDLVGRNLVSPELNDLLADILTDLHRFQDRVYHQEPIKFKTKRRYVAGIKETKKKLNRITLLVLAADVKRNIPVLYEQLRELIDGAKSFNIPIVFGLSRARMSYILHMGKKMKVSCIGVLNYQGTEVSSDF